jgi:tetratricopeptide (TPR) repeat protein
MLWFGKQRKLDAKTVSQWVGSVRSNADRNQFRQVRKNVQSKMLDEIATHILPMESDTDGQTAYLMIHFFSGRASLPAFAIALQVSPETTEKAETLFLSAVSRPSPTSDFELAVAYNCSLEITNETLVQHYKEAILLANHGLKHWPNVAEIWRQRGVLRLTQDDYKGALDDLQKARNLKSDMFWLEEPIQFAQNKISGNRTSP